jgi:prepilin-type processing-associated H-X9-DG protein
MTSGMLYSGSRTRIIDATDGSSNTLLVGERPPSADMVFGWWYSGSGQLLTGQADSHLGVQERNLFGALYHGCPRVGYSFQSRERSDPCLVFQFWSYHGDGAHFALTDGSVRILTFKAASVLPALSTRAGGEVVVVPE